jgi:hypothetical protein
MANIYYRFDSLSALLDIAEKHSHSGVSESIRGFSRHFHETKSWEECMNIARHGYQERERIKAIADAISVSASIKKPEILFDVTGDCGFEMGSVIAGIPECVMDWRETETKATGQQIVKIQVHTCYSAAIDKEAIKSRGAAICALVDAIETSGRRCEVEAVYYTVSSRDKQNTFSFSVIIKHSDEPLEIDRLAFVLAHPDMQRRITFALYCQDAQSSKLLSSEGGAVPTTYPNPDADIYFDKMLLGEHQWTTVAKTKQFIIDRLASLGIELEK